jgi:GNAT superfamily N-acetyltransferase
MGWDIRKVDVHDDDVMHRVYAMTHAASQHERDDAPIWTEQEHTAEYRAGDPGELVECYGAYDGDELVGCALYALFLNDNTDKAFLLPWVEPHRRRQGIGSALLDHMTDLAVAAGRTVLLSQTVYAFERRDDHPYRRFAEKHGYELSLTQIRRELALPVAEDTLQGWIDDARPHHDGYRLEFHTGLLPDEYLPSFCHAMNQLIVDAPQGNVSFEPESMSPERLRERHQNDLQAGRTVYSAIGVHDDTNEVVAYSTIAVVSGNERDMHQWGTLVRSDHRGHRLGLAVKARCLLEVQRLYPPERARISTTNAEDNAQMVAINEQMGYCAMEVEPEFARHLQ